MKKLFYILSLLIIFLASCTAGPSEQEDSLKVPSLGPMNGYLLLAGGSVNEEIWDKFKNLMGGVENHLVVIPTALNSDSLDAVFLEKYRQRFLGLGFQNVTVLHTRSKDVANSDSFIQPLKTASGVWFSGGRQWRHADAYLDTRTHKALNDLLIRGGVIGGASAGATIHGSYLARGDTGGNTVMMGDHQRGLSFITNTAIDQHFIARNRHFDMFEILDEHPGLLGIGIDEKNTAIVVHKNRFQVIGESYVAIYDGTRWSQERDTIFSLPYGSREFYFLSDREEYDVEKRRVVTYADREFISLSRKQLENLSGKYRKENNDYSIEFIIENDSLKVHESDNSKYTLYAESPSRLFIPETDISFEFEFGKDRKAVGFYIPIGDETFRRVKD